MKKPLEAIFFDVDDTIYSTTDFSAKARRNAVRAMIDAGLQMSEKDCLTELEEVIAEFSSNYEHHFDKLLLRIPREKLGGTNPLILVAAGMTGYHDTKFRHLFPYEDAIEVLRMLREKKVRLGVITAGTGIKQAEKVIRLGLHHLVDSNAIFITDTIGIAKTNPKLYLRACQAIHVDPHKTMYVGDRPTSDVDTPGAVGLYTVLSRRTGKYLNEQGTRQPDHIIHNFYDLMELIDRDYEIMAR